MYAKSFICYLFWWLYSMIQCFAICKTDDWCSNSRENFNDYTSFPICFSWCFNKCHFFCGKCTVHKSFYSMWLPSMGFMLFPNASSLYPPNISSLWTTTWHVCKVDFFLLQCLDYFFTFYLINQFIYSLAIMMVGLLTFSSKYSIQWGYLALFV